MSSTKRKICPGLTWVAPKTYESRVTATDPQTGKRADHMKTHHNVPNDRAAMKAHEAYRDEILDAVRLTDEWTVREAIESYLPTLTFGTRRARLSHTNRLVEQHGERQLSKISTAEWQRWLTALPLSPLSANQNLTTLRCVYAHAASRGRLLGVNTAVTVQRLREQFDEAKAYKEAQGDAQPHKALLGEDRARVMDLMREKHPHMFPFFHVQLLLGLRWSEAAGLQWGDIDWRTGVVQVRRIVNVGARLTLPKGKRRRVTSLGPDGLAFMRAHRANMEREGWEGWQLWAFPRPPYGTGYHPRHPQIFDRSEPPLPGYVLSYTRSWECLVGVLSDLGISLETATHTFRHTHVTMSEGFASDAMGRSVQLAMAGHGESARRGYVDQSHYEAVAVDFAHRFDAALAGVEPRGTQSGTRGKKPQKIRRIGASG